MKGNQETADFSQFVETGNTLLHNQAQSGNVSEWMKFVAITNVDPVNANGETPLHLAAKYGKLNNAKCLLSLGANVAAVDKNGNTPLHSAMSVGNQCSDQLLTPYIIEHLINAGADINALNNHGFKPLHSAAEFGNPAILDCLLRHGSNINEKTREGFTPVLLALSSGNLANARLLLNKGADTTIVDALEIDYPEIIEKIKINFSSLIFGDEDCMDFESHEEARETKEYQDDILYQMLKNKMYFAMNEENVPIFSTVYNIYVKVANIFILEFYRFKSEFFDFTATINYENDSIDFLGNPSFIFDEESDSWI